MNEAGSKVGWHAVERDAGGRSNFFVRGKQRRTKRRVTVIDDKIIDDSDTWLLANANDCARDVSAGEQVDCPLSWAPHADSS